MPKKSMPGLCAMALILALGHAQDPGRGRELFEKRCTGCHSLDTEKEGPRLRGVYGRVSGSVANFAYSDALKNARITWASDTLEQWLADTEKLVPDNDMSFQVVKPDERAAIIAYLKQLSER